MNILDIVQKILEKNTCDSCLGRVFAQLLSGYTNAERGHALRTALALAIDSGLKFEGNHGNFAGFKFRSNKDFDKLEKKAGTCEICGGFFQGNLDKLSARVANQLRKLDAGTFLIGTQLSQDLLDREEKLWEKVGIDFAEPVRAEINREVGKRVEALTGKAAELKKPDVAIILDLKNNRIRFSINPLFIFGYYKKLKRGFPQCKWGTPRKYKTSIEEEIGKPLLKTTGGRDTKFHGCGREDIDARCLDWRPFVIEINRPKVRKIDFRKLEKQVARSGNVAVKGLRISDMATVRKIKEAAPDKTYRALVSLKKAVKPKELKKLKQLVGTIHQRTPERVLHRRADLSRKRDAFFIKWRRKGAKKIELIVKGSSGLYIKELVSGDNGRTRPSVAEVLDTDAVVMELDVIRIGKVVL